MGSCVLKDKVDVLALAGGRAKALNLYFPVKVENGEAFYKGEKCNGAMQSGSLLVSFATLGIDNPMVSGIILFKGPIEGKMNRN